jgi:hypothetical protein
MLSKYLRTTMVHEMNDFKILSDAALPGEMDLLCAQYEGFIDIQRFWRKSLKVQKLEGCTSHDRSSLTAYFYINLVSTL